MSIFNRLNQVIKSNVNSLLDAAEDPDKMIGQHISDMESELKKAKGELLTTMGTAKRLEKKREEVQGEIKTWEDKAVLALKSGDENLAREALRWKTKAEKEAADLATQAAGQATAADQMKVTLEKIEAKIEEMKNRKGTLAAQIRQSRSGATSASAPEAAGGAFGELQRMTDKLEQYEAEVEAHAVLDDTRRAEVDAKFRELERSGAGAPAGGVDDQLAALKRKLEGK